MQQQVDDETYLTKHHWIISDQPKLNIYKYIFSQNMKLEYLFICMCVFSLEFKAHLRNSHKSPLFSQLSPNHNLMKMNIGFVRISDD